jgi:UDP-glucose 4-epimerase
MSKVLVTGCAGLLGSHFTRHLLDKGHHVIGIDDLSGGYIENLDSRVEFYNVNLVDKVNVDDVFKRTKPDYVYHFAAYAAVGLSPFIRNFNYTNNVVASSNVINCCINYEVEKIVFTSSMDVYGSAYDPPYTEDMKPDPEDPYGIAKYAVEMDLKHASRLFGLRYSIVRPHNVFGIYQNIWDKYRNVLGIWIRQTLSDQPITVYGDGSQVRSFSDIKFYMEPFEMLMSCGDGQIYNIGADTEITILEASNRLRSVAKNLGYNTRIVHLEPRDEVKVAFCDHTKSKQHLGFKDDTQFEDLITDMFKWASSQPNRPVKMMDYEIEKKMYSFWKK